MPTAAWRELELLVADIQRQLAPDATVEHDVRLPGRESGTTRQVDVLVRQRVGQFEIVVAIDCKNYSKPVDVKGVEEFYGLVSDIGAHKGVLVCPAGFAKAAKRKAAHYRIDLYSPFDTGNHKWQIKASIPMLCDYRGAAMAFGIRISSTVPWMLPHDYLTSSKVYDEHGSNLGTIVKIGLSEWNNGHYPIEVGRHEKLPLLRNATLFMDNGYGQRMPVDLYVSVRVSRRLYFGYVPLKEIRGFKDEVTGGVIANAFETGALDLQEVERTWHQLQCEKDAPARPAMLIQGLDCFEIGAS